MIKKKKKKYAIFPILRTRSNFSEMIGANKKDFIFRQGNFMMNVLHLSLSKSIALSICSRDPMKNLTLAYFCNITYSPMHRNLQL